MDEGEEQILTDGSGSSNSVTLTNEKIYKPLTLTFGKINQMSQKELVSSLNNLNLCTSGTRDVLLKRLKNYYKNQKLASLNLLPENKLVPYYLVVDFEATCNFFNAPDYPHEIIEFPAVLVSSKERNIVDHFQCYVKPEINPKLSQFCTELTGITQEMVDTADTFPTVLEKFEHWMSKLNLKRKGKCVFVTDGPWDMAQFLHGQCKVAGLPYPKWALKWLNVRKVFRNFYKGKMCNLKSMLDTLGLKFEGRPHCGLDDAHNIARILLTLMDEGAPLKINERLDLNQYWRREKALLASATTIVQKRPDSEELLAKLQQLTLNSNKSVEKRGNSSNISTQPGQADFVQGNSSSGEESIESDEAEDSILWTNNKFAALSKKTHCYVKS